MNKLAVLLLVVGLSFPALGKANTDIIPVIVALLLDDCEEGDGTGPDFFKVDPPQTEQVSSECECTVNCPDGDDGI